MRPVQRGKLEIDTDVAELFIDFAKRGCCSGELRDIHATRQGRSSSQDVVENLSKGRSVMRGSKEDHGWDLKSRYSQIAHSACRINKPAEMTVMLWTVVSSN